MRVRVEGLMCCLLACLAEPAGPTGSATTATSSTQVWVFHIAGGAYKDHVQVAVIRARSGDPKSYTFQPVPSRAWDGSPVDDLALYTASPDDADGSHWTLQDQWGQRSKLAYEAIGDTARGTFTRPDGTSLSVFGVVLDSLAQGLVTPTAPSGERDSVPRILIRVDDAAASDTAFLRRLWSRQLPGEIAVPTRHVGRPGRLTWSDLDLWQDRGMTIAAHSLVHDRTAADDAYFIREVVGSLADLAARGMTSHVFVEPGTWRDSILFDSPAKLRTWRGALLRTFTTVFEGYAYKYDLPYADSLALGLGHFTVSDGSTQANTTLALQRALQLRRSTVFLVHTFRLATPDQLDWFLDSIAAARSRGVVRVVGSSDRLFGALVDSVP